MADPAESPGDPPLLCCRSVSRVYEDRDGGWLRRRPAGTPVTALADVSLTVERGTVLGLVGPSGSGKSTLVHLLAGLDAPTSGSVAVDGRALDALSAREHERFRLERVGLVFQRFHLLPALSATSNVALPLLERGVGTEARRERAAALLESVGLADRREHRPGELSGGEQQRVAIARALATDPDVVLADEPTGELDSATGGRVLDVLTDAAADRAVILASHDPAVGEVADRVVQLRDGRVVGDG